MNRLMESLLRILALTRKELLAVLKDRRSRMSLLIPPVVQALIFGYAATYDLNHVTYAALDQDHTAASRNCSPGSMDRACSSASRTCSERAISSP